MSSGPPPNVAIDLDLLEKEIEANEQSRKQQTYTDLSGNIAGVTPPTRTRSQNFDPSADPDAEFDTLDEPVWDTIRRDLRLVGAKFARVLKPDQNKQLLRDWDLWGPLFICVLLSLLLQGGVGGPHFTEVFSITFFGSCIVTANTKLLGGTISIFQSICVLGYCLLPLAVAAIGCKFVAFSSSPSIKLTIKLVITAVGFGWAIFASMGFLAGSQPEKRRLLIIYPVVLFYFVVSWLTLSYAS
uniref:Protein YIPF n=2 Tax=Acrobeloides nanus TaxID=290746 RepID=A0A914CX60_9BILA